MKKTILIWQYKNNKRTHEVYETIIKGKKQFFYHLKGGNKIIVHSETYKRKSSVVAAIASIAMAFSGDYSIALKFKSTYIL